MIAGFVGFQLYEDGTTLSIWVLRFCTTLMFLISFAVALLTFKSWAGLGPENTVGLFVVVYFFSALFLAVYITMQLILVLGTLQERWPLLHIFFGVFAFVLGQIVLYVFSQSICDSVEHYMDGLFFATLLNLLAVMMVYKVRDKHYLPPTTLATDSSRSTGTPLRKKTSSSLSACARTIGKSKISSQKTTSGTPSTMTANMPVVSIISSRALVVLCTSAMDNAICNPLRRLGWI